MFLGRATVNLVAPQVVTLNRKARSPPTPIATTDLNSTLFNQTRRTKLEGLDLPPPPPPQEGGSISMPWYPYRHGCNPCLLRRGRATFHPYSPTWAVKGGQSPSRHGNSELPLGRSSPSSRPSLSVCGETAHICGQLEEDHRQLMGFGDSCRGVPALIKVAVDHQRTYFNVLQ